MGVQWDHHGVLGRPGSKRGRAKGMFCSRNSSLHLQPVLPAQGGAGIPAGFVQPALHGWQNLLKQLSDSLKESGRLWWLLAHASAGLAALGSSDGCRGHSPRTCPSLSLPARQDSLPGGVGDGASVAEDIQALLPRRVQRSLQPV